MCEKSHGISTSTKSDPKPSQPTSDRHPKSAPPGRKMTKTCFNGVLVVHFWCVRTFKEFRHLPNLTLNHPNRHLTATSNQHPLVTKWQKHVLMVFSWSFLIYEKSEEFLPFIFDLIIYTNLRPRTSDLEPRTSNLEPPTSNFEPRALNLEPRASNLGRRT